MGMVPDIQILHHNLNALEQSWKRNRDVATHGYFHFGIYDLDQRLGGGLQRGLLHQAHVEKTSGAAALVLFGAALAQRVDTEQRPIVWIRQNSVRSEAGELHAQGFTQLGIDPGALIIVRACNMASLLSAALDAVRCAALSSVILETWGTSRALDLTATRRLALAAARSGVTPILLRVASDPQPSVAHTRWQVAAAPSRPLPANAPGRPTFDLTLLRNRAGAAGQRWRVEWDHERRQFQSVSPLSRPVVSVPVRRQVETSEGGFVRTG